MAATTVLDFDKWLSVKLKSLNTDESIFGDYIKGILEGEESQDEKIEALEGIMVEISPTDGMTQNEICQEILKQWELCLAAAAEGKSNETVRTAVDIQIAKIMEQQALCVIPQKKASDEERKLKQTILSQYAEVSDGEGGLDDDDAGYDDDVDDRLLARNTNAEDVMKLEKIKKESLRQESQKKKDKDKEDREKQKQLAIDRKEKEKKRTQKGEKKR
uniref:Coiled-coil domain-containing protein 43 n=1 Tax=Daphnia similis TaxID=35528 RepID=A0A4Y7LTW9_9CRUS|nr:EOG090X0H15 [Daphnia similis]SVE71398.1 EOG090X0H15 [Daphnia similis]SVE72031.1 EOG090X0H15 [Daphnia similis]SVE72658.1 EOG090X0H15 [Daphnia similis]